MNLMFFRYNKILIDCVFGNSKFVVPETLTFDPVNKYILFNNANLKNN